MIERDTRPAGEAVTLDEFAALGRTLLESLPAHWHDDAVVEFRDAVEAVEAGRAVQPQPNAAHFSGFSS